MSLRKIVLDLSGQDVRQCRNCATCSRNVQDQSSDILDISLEGMIQMIIMDDEEIMTSRTVWSDQALVAVQHACQRGMNLPAIILALRTEAAQRGLAESDL